MTMVRYGSRWLLLARDVVDEAVSADAQVEDRRKRCETTAASGRGQSMTCGVRQTSSG